MQLLLDSHSFIWFINGDQQLPGKVFTIIYSGKASLREMSRFTISQK